MSRAVKSIWTKENNNSLLMGYLMFLLLTVCSSTILGQQLSVRATVSLDTNRIRIGEQVQLHFDVVAPAGAFVFFPFLPDTMHNIEVVERSPVDTVKTDDNNSVNYRQQITLTCFDPGIYLMQPFRFLYRYSAASPVDSVATDMLMLQVDTISVDTTKAIRDIKPPIDVPLTLREALPYIIAAIITLAVIAFLVYYIRKRRRSTGDHTPKIPLRPAHETALETLRKLQEQKLWQQGFYKEYQSAVSDTIRNYIEHRFTVPAMELTSDETMERLRRSRIKKAEFEKLKYIFQLADMVKFAKSLPLGTENELSMQYAFDFVMATKPVTKDDFADNDEEKEVQA